MSNYAYLFKFIMVGNSAVGKSCLLLQYEQGRLNDEHDTTIGVEFGSKVVAVAGENIKIQVWDTAGQENFRSLIRSYYRSAIGALVVYDITRQIDPKKHRRQTFYDLQRWIEDIRDNGNPTVMIIVCGNKDDLEDKREVSFEEGQNFANQHNLMFLETSAKTGHNVDEAFNSLCQKIYQRIQDGTLTLGKHEPGVKTGKLFKGSTLGDDEQVEIKQEKKTSKDNNGCC